MKLTKKQMIEKVSEATGITQADCERVMNAHIELIADELAAGNPVGIQRFGTFSVKATKARVGRNVRTGKPIDIPAGKRPHFSPRPHGFLFSSRPRHISAAGRAPAGASRQDIRVGHLSATAPTDVAVRVVLPAGKRF